MSSRPIVLVAAMAVVTGIAGSHVSSQSRTPRAYEADVFTTYTAPGGEAFTSVGRLINGDDGSTREESPLSTTVFNARTKEVAMLHKGNKEALVMPLPDGPPRDAVAQTRAVRGTRQVVDGRPVVRHVAQFGEFTQEVWVDEEQQVVVYTQMSSPTMTVTKKIKNIQFKPVSPDAFSVPLDYRRIPAPAPDVLTQGRPLPRPQ
jgi:hypothetical protein